MQKQRKRGRSFRRQSLPLCPRKMSLERIEVCFQGSVRAFMEIASFTAWVNSIRGPSKVIGIRGVSAKSGPGNEELSDFMTSVLHIEGTPGCWRRRRTGFLQKRCGYCLTEEGAVRRTTEKARETRENFSPAEMQENQITLTVGDVVLQEALPIVMTSEARGNKSSLRTEKLRLCPLSESLRPLLSFLSSESLQQPLSLQQQRPNYPDLSADDRSATQLSSLEREALRMRGRPWDAPGPWGRSLRQCYPIWHMWHHMSEERKGLVRRRLEF